MGVLGGDILVAEFPATIKIAFFIEYEPGSDDGKNLSVAFRLLLDETEIAKGKFDQPTPKDIVSFVLPTGFMAFEKEGIVRMRFAVNGRPEEEILSKSVRSAKATS
jgi:hypothetical protein